MIGPPKREAIQPDTAEPINVGKTSRLPKARDSGENVRDMFFLSSIKNAAGRKPRRRF